MGYVAGGLVAGLLADAIDFRAAIEVVAALTAASGVWVLLDMPKTVSVQRPVAPGEQLAS
jgi:predicted MFS family arabinose efflux permease